MSKETIKRQEWCPVPGCDKYVAIGSKIPLCRKHVLDLNFLMWALENVKFPDKEDKKKTKSGLILP